MPSSLKYFQSSKIFLIILTSEFRDDDIHKRVKFNISITFQQLFFPTVVNR